MMAAAPDYQPNLFSDFNISDCTQLICTPFCPQLCLPFPPPPPFELLEHESDPNFSPLVIAIIGILASTFLLVTYYTIVAKYCTNWESLRRRLQRGGNDTYDDDDDESQTLPSDSWPLVTTGLEESVIRSIPVCKYKRGDGLVECTDCSICLSEFQEDESLRLLPKCNHAFHLPCIDTWLQSHSNCPICRANIVRPALLLPAETRVSIPPEVSVSNAQLPVENQESNLREESRPNSAGNSSQVNESGSSVGMDRKEEGERIEQEKHVFKALIPPHIRALSDLASKHRRDGSLIEFTGEWQPMRRSVSLGTSSRFCISISDMMAMQPGFEHGDPNVLEQNVTPPESSSHRKSLGHEWLVFKGFGKHFGQYQSKAKAPGDVSKSGILHNLKGPLTMKRSFSGRNFFLSKYSRSRNAVLPL